MKMMNCGDDCDCDVLWCWLIRDDGSERSQNSGKNDDDDDDDEKN